MASFSKSEWRISTMVLSVVLSMSWSIHLSIHPPAFLSLLAPLPLRLPYKIYITVFTSSASLSQRRSRCSLRHPLDSTDTLFSFWERLSGGAVYRVTSTYSYSYYTFSSKIFF
ncbi:hypothetical protein EV421DRAFT_1261576 [Armillaria borealis]|uniref:Uncharacterized protein n=1 Tax=Armillaria borealis TaxID=47425 RepID=A0AA39J4B3_9AGAR|nr:hypothetical protein EV421DRAFT_1261576 [Armillaria borealis]